ncbi:short-chain dehydrogenase TIC 32, chloroplastic-like isoform X2 [Euphorbia lathyris]|uniref:short-chain dehydrogenase TIC 32, chloroplastic-like isoform X2 n=1 Tax=Euphorbia lathyris TaxID=212925 RepID=UPI003313B247
MWIFGWKGPSGFSARSTAEQVTQGIDGTALTAIVIGLASSGIGVETARVLAMRGVYVVMAVRNVEAATKIKQTILKENPSAKLEVMQIDLSSMASIRKFASQYISSGLPLNILINNAAVVIPPFTLSEDNIELQFATNHVGHFLLTDLLLEIMKNTARESNQEGRIFNVSSIGHHVVYREGIRFDKINDQSVYNKYIAYGQSKLANILHANELARRLKEDGVDITANSLHPGGIATNLARHHSFVSLLSNFFLLKNHQQGAATTCYVALHPQVKGVTGQYFADSNLAKPSSLATNSELGNKLWDFSFKLTFPN